MHMCLHVQICMYTFACIDWFLHLIPCMDKHIMCFSMHACMHMCLRVQMHVHFRMHRLIFAFDTMYCMHASILLCAFPCMHACICAYMCTCMYTFTDIDWFLHNIYNVHDLVCISLTLYGASRRVFHVSAWPFMVQAVGFFMFQLDLLLCTCMYTFTHIDWFLHNI